MSKRLIVFFAAIMLCITSTQPANAWFGPKAGDVCKVQSETKQISGKPYICETDNKGIMRWLINAQPKDSDAALALVTEGCTEWYGKEAYQVYFSPISMMGALWEKAVNESRYKYPSDKSGVIMMENEIKDSKAKTTRFESAATLDNKWVHLNSLWVEGVDNAYRRWRQGGVSFVNAITSSNNNLDSIQSICKVAVKKSQQSALQEKRLLSTWLLRNSKGYVN